MSSVNDFGFMFYVCCYFALNGLFKAGLVLSENRGREMDRWVGVLLTHRACQGCESRNYA